MEIEEKISEKNRMVFTFEGRGQVVIPSEFIPFGYVGIMNRGE